MLKYRIEMQNGQGRVVEAEDIRGALREAVIKFKCSYADIKHITQFES